jgi:hypothetical protein
VYDEKTNCEKQTGRTHAVNLHACTSTSRKIRLLTFFDPKKTAFKSAEP